MLHPFVLLTLAAACWGFGTVVSKQALDQFEPVPLLIVQLGVSVMAVALFHWCHERRTLDQPPHRSGMRAAALGVLNPGIAYALGLSWTCHDRSKHGGRSVGVRTSFDRLAGSRDPARAIDSDAQRRTRDRTCRHGARRLLRRPSWQQRRGGSHAGGSACLCRLHGLSQRSSSSIRRRFASPCSSRSPLLPSQLSLLGWCSSPRMAHGMAWARSMRRVGSPLSRRVSCTTGLRLRST